MKWRIVWHLQQIAEAVSPQNSTSPIPDEHKSLKKLELADN